MVRNLNSGSKKDGASRLARRRDARRLEILRAASQTFRNQGFAATGMRDIAAAADLSPGNLYHYFRGKHELLYFCQDESLERLSAALRMARRSRQAAAAQLRAVIAAHVRCVAGEMQGAAAHLEVDDLPPALKRAIVAKRDRYERGIRSIVAGGIRSREFLDCDPKLAAQAILGAVNWTARWFRPDGARSAQEVGERFADYLVRGLLVHPDRPQNNGGTSA